MHDPQIPTNGGVASGDEGQPITMPLTAHLVDGLPPMPLLAAPFGRIWMDETDRRFAYRCLPMVIANQAGWFVLSNHKIAVTWNGGAAPSDLCLEYLAGEPPHNAVSVFGSGILTWSLPYLFRTPPGYNLLVRGPANYPKDGASPLEGIVETDWTEATFTMNWKLTRANHTVIFELGEPIAMIVPQPRGELEIFRPEIRDLAADPALHNAFTAWSRSRRQFSEELRQPGSVAQQRGWQKHYMRGESVLATRSTEHQSRLALHDFVDQRGATASARTPS